MAYDIKMHARERDVVILADMNERFDEMAQSLFQIIFRQF